MDPFFEDWGADFYLIHLTHSGNLGVMHIHPHYEMFLLTDSFDATFCINGMEYPLNRPFLYVVSPFYLHRLDFKDSKSQIERCVCYFGNALSLSYPKLIAQFMDSYKNSAAVIFFLNDDMLQRCRELRSLFASYPHNSEEQKMLFFLLLRSVMYSDCERVTVGNTDVQIQQIILYMNEHLSEKIDADSVAQKFYISRSKMDKDFQKYTSVTFRHLLTEMRLCHAELLLRDHSLKFSDIAMLSGFESETYFFSLFKKHRGITPLKYRKTK